MAKAVLQSVGDDTVAFNDQCYWVQENVKRFLSNFQPGMEVDVTVKDIDGTPMVTFLKKAGFAPAQGSRPAYPPAGQQGGYQAPRAPAPSQPAPRAPAPAASAGMDAQALFTLAATIAVAYNVDPDAIREMVTVLKRPPTPPQVAAPPVVPPQPLPGEPTY